MQLTRETIAHATEAEWLAARRRDITSTEASALFGASPYATEFQLHHRKAGTLEDNFVANDRMKWGNRLEHAIAMGVAEDLGLVVEPFKVYMRIPELRMGSSFDFKIVGMVPGFDGDQAARDMFREHGAGIMEVKNVDGLQFRRGWIDDGETLEAPPHIEFQVQHQLEVADLNWTVIAPLVGGNTPRPILRQRDREVGALICEHTRLFWQRFDSGIAPVPNYVDDAEAIAQLHVNNDGSSIDLSDNPRVFELCLAYKSAAATAKVAEEHKKAAKAELLTIIGAAKSINAGAFKISAGTNKESYRAFHRESSQRVSISVSQIPACDVEATVAPFRNVRITEVA